MTLDVATRVYNHGFRIDPIVRTLLDTDFYKFLMLQLIRATSPDVRATFGLINRTKSVRLADVIDERELRDQLDHARTLRFQKNELIWLAGNTFYGVKQIFKPDFLDWLEDFRLPEYDLHRTADGQYELLFEGHWSETTLWEVPALAIVSELRARAAMKGMSRFELDVLYAKAKAKLWGKIERLRVLGREGPLKIADFGTRRRHGFLWQKWCVEALQEGLGDNFVGTSNVKMAMDAGLEAIGTNAHELPMVYAALAEDDAALHDAPYKVLKDWAEMYDGNLLVILPDTYGTTAFLREVTPEAFVDWTRDVDLLVPNLDEARLLVGATGPFVDFDALTRMYPHVVVTLGSMGAAYVAGDTREQVAAPRVQVIDTTGAGDAFTAGFLSSWVSGRDPRAALQGGIGSASRCIQQRGARP